MTGAAKIPSYATLLENEIAALRKQNDALVAALEAVESNRGTQTCLVCEEYDHANDCEVGAALEQVKQ